VTTTLSQHRPTGRAGPVTRPTRRVRPVVLFATLGVSLVVACVIATGTGAFAIPPGQIIGSIADRLGLSVGSLPNPTAEAVLWNIRLPRVALAVVVGASLGCGGAAMQGSFSNPLAEPGIVGVSSGAALGAVTAIVTGATLLGTWTVTGAAFIGGVVVVFAVYWAARTDGRSEVVTLILTGIAVNAFIGALIGLLMFVSTDAQLRSVTFWNLGSLAQATWPKVLAVTPAAVLGIAVASTQAHRLDLLALGDRAARHVGVDVERLRIVMLTTVAVLTAAAVAVSGIILFVGLVVPHLVRMVAGPGHRLLLPASALGGALLLVVADLVARTIAPPAELPLGVLTALVGSPFFFWMLRRTRSRQGGWA
jgi:iron complex transport system permease protein